MKHNLVEVKLHGNIFPNLKNLYKLAVRSVSEAIHAVNMISRNHFYKTLLENDKKGIKYRVLINGRDFVSTEPLTTNNLEKIKESELVMQLSNLQTIDIVPVVEGADSDIGAIIAGVLLVVVGIVVGVVAGWTGIGGVFAGALIVGGLGLVAAGVINLLSSPPKFEDFREIGGGGRVSYLFSGPQQTVNEGGPVPLGYGRLLIGSHVISASYEISEVSAKERLTV